MQGDGLLPLRYTESVSSYYNEVFEKGKNCFYNELLYFLQTVSNTVCESAIIAFFLPVWL